MSDSGWPDVPKLPWWILKHGPWPVIDPVQKVISEKDLPEYLASGYVFTHQLQSGAVVVTKNVNLQDVINAGRQVLAKGGH